MKDGSCKARGIGGTALKKKGGRPWRDTFHRRYVTAISPEYKMATGTGASASSYTSSVFDNKKEGIEDQHGYPPRQKQQHGLNYDIGRVCRVRVSRKGVVRELLLHPDMISLDDLHECCRALFPDIDSKAPVIALKNETNTLFPISLLACHPNTFAAARKRHAHAHVHHCTSLELMCLGDDLDVPYVELTRSHRVGWHDEDDEKDEYPPHNTSLFHDMHGPFNRASPYTFAQLIDVFGSAAPTGALDRHSFMKCMAQLRSRSRRPQDHKQHAHHEDDNHQGHHHHSQDEQDPNDDEYHRSLAMFSQLFDLFDKDRHGVVDVVAFMTGLSVLVQDSGMDRDEKIQRTFSLYDINGDGYISLDEMTTYLTSVYLVMAALNPKVFENHGYER
jgi:hypothetical protein